MAGKPTVRGDQIKRAREILAKLPSREHRLTRQEAAAQLETTFRRAFRKGYTPAELSKAIKKEGVFIPVYLIQQYFDSKDKPDSAPAEEQSRDEEQGTKQEVRKSSQKRPLPKRWRNRKPRRLHAHKSLSSRYWRRRQAHPLSRATRLSGERHSPAPRITRRPCHDPCAYRQHRSTLEVHGRCLVMAPGRKNQRGRGKRSHGCF